ncbi:hypothetical protein Tco_1204195 [Tanacetum coccineum]
MGTLAVVLLYADSNSITSKSKNGNLTEKVVNLKKILKDVQTEVEKDPFNYVLKERAVKRVLSEDEAENMISMVTSDEIKEAIFDIDSNKAFGPDGYTSGFFKKAWSIIGKEVCLAIRDFFINGKLLGEINAIMIALVPKLEVPNKVSEFRPISYCNVIYKSISKILTTRIKNGLQKVVNINQSAFIPSKHIQNNILIAQELLKGYSRKMVLEVGKLPMRYLGVPLISKKLGVNDCKSLVDKVTDKINCQKSKILAYARRIQLIASVLSSMQGGLGIKSLKKTNEILLINQLWKVIEGKESLCDIKGPLSDIIPRRVWYEERYSDNEKVIDMIDRGVWIWPASWHNRFPELCNINVPILSNGVTNKVLWLDNQNEKNEFSTKQAWCDLRDNVVKVEWYHVVWFSQFQPRHAFCYGWISWED